MRPNRPNLRQHVRRTVFLPAKFDAGDGMALRDCTVVDISDGGARLTVADPITVPNEFILFLSPRGFPLRRCRVVWRTANQMGVEFESQLERRVRIHEGEVAAQVGADGAQA
jgi:hypothetical protein